MRNFCIIVLFFLIVSLIGNIILVSKYSAADNIARQIEETNKSLTNGFKKCLLLADGCMDDFVKARSAIEDALLEKSKENA